MFGAATAVAAVVMVELVAPDDPDALEFNFKCLAFSDNFGGDMDADDDADDKDDDDPKLRIDGGDDGGAGG